jgi:hypothetical protein
LIPSDENIMETNQALDEFLQKKGIDAVRFARARHSNYTQCAGIMLQAGAIGLDYAHKFQWNDWRLEFPVERDTLKKD